MARAPLSLKARAVGLLAQREQSRAELRRKLLRIEQQRQQRLANASGADASDDESDATEREMAVDALLDVLAADGYLNEARFVESRVHQRASRFGTQRIQQELAQHGLRLDAEQQAALRETELERAREVWLKRFGPEPAREAAEQARQTRFLLARGFAPDLVRRLLKA
jgi:regulatory protein